MLLCWGNQAEVASGKLLFGETRRILMDIDLKIHLDTFCYHRFLALHLHIEVLIRSINSSLFIIFFSNSNSINALISSRQKGG